MAVRFNELVVGFTILVLIGVSIAQRIEFPANPCPNVFQYSRLGNTNFGYIMVHNATLNSTDSQITLMIKLSQPGVFNPADSLGKLSLTTSRDRLPEHIRTGRPIVYRVDFPEGNAIPKVTSIKVNGLQICSGPETRLPGRHHILEYIVECSTHYRSVPNASIKNTSWSDSSSEQTQNRSVGGYHHQQQFIQPATTHPTSSQQSFNQPSEQHRQTSSFVESLNQQQVNRQSIGQPAFQQDPFNLPSFIPSMFNRPNVMFGNAFQNPFLSNPSNRNPENTQPSNMINHSNTWLTNPQPQWNLFTGNVNQRNPFLNNANGANDFRPMAEQNPLPPVNRPTLMQSTAKFDFKTKNPALNYSTNAKDYLAPGQDGPRNPPPAFGLAPRTTTTTSAYDYDDVTDSHLLQTTEKNFQAKPAPTPTRRITAEYINQECGLDVFTNFNVNGKIITRQLFPWNAAIFVKKNNDLQFLCGGSLISTRTVVSAAHCLSGPEPPLQENLMISMGRQNIFSGSETQNFDVEKVVTHPQYKPDLMNFDTDLSILWLKDSVIFTPTIKPVCIWQGTLDARNIEGVSGKTVGWTTGANTNRTVVPNYVDSNVLSKTECFRSMEQFIPLTPNRTLCAGTSNASGDNKCPGDSGSGLAIKSHNKWMLRGTTALSFPTTNGKCNAIYSDAAMFADWIRSNMIL